MHNRFLLFVSGALLLMVLHACSSSRSASKNVVPVKPAAAAEFRAAWVATVGNINWPSKRGLSTEEQQREAIEMLDFLQQHNFNAVIFQVRPQADALYQSELEPWSYYLSGVQGKAPEPFYDPLQFWIDAAHDRGIELHVWLNPYRAHSTAGGEVTDNSLVKTKSNLVVKLKDGHWWFDPSKKETQAHATSVVMDIVKRYDIDGVHFDDYFYPYPSYNGNADFPDSTSWKAYVNGGGKLSRGDWRRESVNTFIQSLYKAIKAEKKHVKFGLSPFGLYRPGYPASAEGFDQYEQLYADARLWLNKGWIDYFSPQLYWPINRIPQSFPVLLNWWLEENKKDRHLWPGISVSRDTAAIHVRETLNQIMITRGMHNNGVVHWNIFSLTKNANMANAVVQGPYRRPALVPASPWLDKKAPAAPVVQTKQTGDTVVVQWTHPNEPDVFRWVVYYQHGSRWNYTIVNRKERSVILKPIEGKNKLNRVMVTAVDRTGNESEQHALTPDVVAIVTRKAWDAAEPRPFKQHVPVRITIHHEGNRMEQTADGAKRVKNIQTWGMGKDRNWADVPYHFFVAPDGSVYEGRNMHTTGETATEYDPSGHLLICCLGNLEVQEVPPAQLDALTKLIAYLCRKYNLPNETLSAHKDHSSQTTCPGKNLYQYLQNGYIREKVKELLNQVADQ